MNVKQTARYPRTAAEWLGAACQMHALGQAILDHLEESGPFAANVALDLTAALGIDTFDTDMVRAALEADYEANNLPDPSADGAS